MPAAVQEVGAIGTDGGSVGPRRPRWLLARWPVALAGALVVALAAALLLGRGWRPGAEEGAAVAGGEERSSPLAGQWTGEGRLTRCAGLGEEEGCSGTRPVVLTIDCGSGGCAVTPFDSRYGSPPLRSEDDVQVAAGPVPPDVAPTCGGVPTTSALWRLELTLRDGRLTGTYAESTVQGFDCGATGVAWELALERR